MMPINTPPLIHDVEILLLRAFAQGFEKSAMKMMYFEKPKFSPRRVGEFGYLQTKNMQLNFSDIDGEFERIYLQH